MDYSISYKQVSPGFEGQGAEYDPFINGIGLGDIAASFSQGGYDVNGSPGGSLVNPWTGQREQAFELTNGVINNRGFASLLPESVARALDPNATPWYLRADGGGGGLENLVMLAALAGVGGAAAGGLTGAGAAAGEGALGSGLSLGATGANGLQVAVNPLTSLAELSSGGLGAGLAGGTGAGLELGSGLLSAGAAFAPESLFSSLGYSFPDYALSGLSGLSDLSTGNLGSGLNFGGNSGTGLRLPSSTSLSTMGGGTGITSPLLAAPVSGGAGGMGPLEEMLKKLGIKLPGGGMASNALGVLSFLRGMQGDSNLQKLAAQAMRAPDARVIDPVGMGARAPYLQKLQELYANPTSVTDLPGYKVGLDAIARRSAASGYMGSGNEKIQLAEYGNKFWGDEVSRLASLAGMGFSPSVVTANPGSAISAMNAGNDTASKALATLGYVLRSMNL